MNALATMPDTLCLRDELWEHCRNSLGTARLLVHERRPGALVTTACHLAAETGLRSALEAAGEPFVGDAGDGLARLALPGDLWPDLGGSPREQLAATEAFVARLAVCLRERAPHRTWGF